MASHAQACDFAFRGSDSLFVHVNQNQLKPLNTSPLKSLGINAQKKTKLPSALKGDNVKDFKYAFICWYAKGRAAGRLSRRQRETLKNLSQSCSFAGFVFWISSAELVSPCDLPIVGMPVVACWARPISEKSRCLSSFAVIYQYISLLEEKSIP